MHEFQLPDDGKSFGVRLAFRYRARNPHVLTSDIAKEDLMRLRAPATKRIIVPDVFSCAPGVCKLHVSGGVHVFTRPEADRLACRSFDGESEQCGGVLGEHIGVFAGTGIPDFGR
jgi:hypothetical protein